MSHERLHESALVMFQRVREAESDVSNKLLRVNCTRSDVQTASKKLQKSVRSVLHTAMTEHRQAADRYASLLGQFQRLSAAYFAACLANGAIAPPIAEIAAPTNIVRTHAHSSGRSAAAKKRWENPEFRAKMANAMKQRWKNPAFRAKMLEARRKAKK